MHRKIGSWLWVADESKLQGLSLETLTDIAEQQYGTGKNNLISRKDREVLKVSSETMPVVLKRCKVRLLEHKIRYLFTGSPARRSFNIAGRLKAHGISVPEPIAYGEKRKGGFVVEHCDLSHFVDGLRMLSDTGDRDAAYYRQAALNLAFNVGIMHAAGVSHGDLLLKNITVPAQEDAGPSITVFDFQDATSSWRLSTGKRFFDLAKLLVYSFDLPFSERDRLLFWVHYCRITGYPAKKGIAVRRYALKNLKHLTVNKLINTFENREEIEARGWL